MLAYDFPLLGMFWTLMFWFLWVAWIVLLFRVFADIFRSRDMGGVKKAVWVLLTVVLPFVGVLLYLAVRGGSMAQRDLEQERAHEAAFQAYIHRSVSSGGTAAELSALADLQARGVITEAEFAAQKARLLG